MAADLSRLTLEPLIEFEPREHVRPSPTASGADDPDGWLRQLAGVADVTPKA